MRVRAAAIGATTVLLVTGCGQKGPLYLPDKGAAVVTAPPASPAVPPTRKNQDEDKDQESPPKP